MHGKLDNSFRASLTSANVDLYVILYFVDISISVLSVVFCGYFEDVILDNIVRNDA